MSRKLIAGIVLICCAVGSSWTTHTSTADSAINSDVVVTLVDTTTLEGTARMYVTGPGEMALSYSGITISPTECQHPKLKALGDNCWGSISKHEYCPTEYRQRAYKCRECKKKIVVLQAILIKAKE